MRQNAREHLDLVDLLAEGRASAVDDLLRRHLSAITTDWPAS